MGCFPLKLSGGLLSISDTWNWAQLWIELCMSPTLVMSFMTRSKGGKSMLGLLGRCTPLWVGNVRISQVNAELGSVLSARNSTAAQLREKRWSTACCAHHTGPTGTVLCQQQILWGISCTLGKWLRALGRADHPNSSTHIWYHLHPRGLQQSGCSMDKLCLTLDMEPQTLLLFCSLGQKSFTSGRGSAAGDPQPAEPWPSQHTVWSVTGVGTWSCSCGMSQGNEMKFMLLLCQLYCSSGSTDNTWLSRKPYVRICQKFSDKSEVCIEPALCITCLGHFGSNTKSLSARSTVWINHNFSFCPTGQNQEGKALFQASMKYLETRKNIWMWEKNKKETRRLMASSKASEY